MLSFTVLVALGVALILAGLVGCVLPVLPGPPLSFAGFVLLWAARGWEAHTFGTTMVVVLGGLTVVVTVFDFVAPVIGAQRFGASRPGIWGSVVGMIAGMILLPPLGMLIGAFLGALLGEVASGKHGRAATRAAWGVFMGTV
ncbi:MAG: DUF456 domain-containing protein, partial [Planctomycetota bacterium]